MSWHCHLHFRFIVIVLIFLIYFLARDVGIEPTHRGFGDLTDTLSVSRILVDVTPLVQLFLDMI